jgi:hypothetical protein
VQHTATDPWDRSLDRSPAARWAYLVPTVATAGAETCQLGSVVELSPLVASRPVVGFGLEGGLVAWKASETTFDLLPVSPDGTPRGAMSSVAIDQRYEPNRVFAVGRGFVVLLVQWDFEHGSDCQRRRTVASCTGCSSDSGTPSSTSADVTPSWPGWGRKNPHRWRFA